MVDLDVPRNGSRVQLVHWIATNVTLSGNSSTQLLINNAAAPVPYLQPSPPVGDVPHSYTFALFRQPANFNIPAQYANLSNNRVFFDVARFVSDAQLGNAVAGNWITVQNLTGSATASYPPARPTQTGAMGGDNGTMEFPGTATLTRALSIGGSSGMWVVLSTVLVTGLAAFAL